MKTVLALHCLFSQSQGSRDSHLIWINHGEYLDFSYSLSFSSSQLSVNVAQALFLLIKIQHCAFTFDSTKPVRGINHGADKEKAEALKSSEEFKNAVLASWESSGMASQASLHHELQDLLILLKEAKREYRKGCYALLTEVLKENLKWYMVCLPSLCLRSPSCDRLSIYLQNASVTPQRNRGLNRPRPYLPRISESISQFVSWPFARNHFLCTSSSNFLSMALI